MWGFGGRYYWGRRARGKVEGIVVLFSWMPSQDNNLKNSVDLYSSLGWNSLICHCQFLNLFFPDKAASLALEIVNDLVQELKIRPCPVVFASFSGAPKACTYKVLQIIEGICPEQVNMDEYQLVKDCVSGHIFDSGPVDFTSDLGARFMCSHPLLPSWITNGVSSTMDALFLSRFEAQRAGYWQTLYSTISMGAPYLILCSEDDDLAPCQIICNFAQRLKDLRADVKLVKWNNSSHVGHFRNHPVQYKAAVTELLRKASVIYSKRIRQLEVEKMGFEGAQGEITEPFCYFKKAAERSNQSFQRIALDLNDHFSIPSSTEYHDGRDFGSVQDEHKKPYIHIRAPPSISAHGVLGHFLFDVCVPENVEDWDLKSSPSLRKARVLSTRRHSPFNPMKCIRRSRL